MSEQRSAVAEAGASAREPAGAAAPRADYTKLLNAHLAGLEEYVPIQPLEVLSERLGIPVENLVKLDANENPYGPIEAVTEALARYPHFHIYPDPQQ